MHKNMSDVEGGINENQQTGAGDVLFFFGELQQGTGQSRLFNMVSLIEIKYFSRETCTDSSTTLVDTTQTTVWKGRTILLSQFHKNVNGKTFKK